MNIARFLIALVAATIVASFTDWFFFGVLFHSRYETYPEVWRTEFSGKKEWKAIVLVTLLLVFMAGGFLVLLHYLDMHGFQRVLSIAFAIWLIVAVPMNVSNFIFMKLDQRILFSQTLGWLVRMLVFAAAFLMILDR
jgi:hypothetical protein